MSRQAVPIVEILVGLGSRRELAAKDEPRVPCESLVTEGRRTQYAGEAQLRLRSAQERLKTAGICCAMTMPGACWGSWQRRFSTASVPPVDAPTAILTGENPTDSVICSLFGSTTPLTPEQLAARYEDHDAYVAAVTESADAAVADGFLQQQAADDLIAEAEKADVPG